MLTSRTHTSTNHRANYERAVCLTTKHIAHFGSLIEIRTMISAGMGAAGQRSEEHTAELQSHHDLVCRVLLEKKKTRYIKRRTERVKFSMNSQQETST